MTESTPTSPLDQGLDYTKDLPGYRRTKPRYLDERSIDALFDAILRLTGEVWVNRDRLTVIEHLLESEGSVSKDLIERFQPSEEMRAEMDAARKELVNRVFAQLYQEFGNAEEARFVSAVTGS